MSGISGAATGHDDLEVARWARERPHFSKTFLGEQLLDLLLAARRAPVERHTEAKRSASQVLAGLGRGKQQPPAGLSARWRLAAEPKGLLRVAGPFDFNRHLPRLISQFMKAHPDIDLELRLSNRTLDMVDEGIDVYVRITNSLPPDVVARPLAITRLSVWGAPSYFRTHKRPRTPAELSGHRFALFNEPPLLDEWVFERHGKQTKVRLKPVLITNAGEGQVAAVCEGVALGVIPSFLLPHDQRKLLEPVLLEWSLGGRGIYAVYPHRRFVPAKVRVFVDFLRQELADGRRDPWWPDGIPVPGSQAHASERHGQLKKS